MNSFCYDFPVELAKYVGDPYSPGPGTSLNLVFILYYDPKPFLELALNVKKAKIFCVMYFFLQNLLDKERNHLVCRK